MIRFALAFSLAYLAVALLSSGVGHLARLAHFPVLVRQHGTLPARFALLTAVAVTAFEVAGGSLALALLLLGDQSPLLGPFFGSAAVAGALFLRYVCWLLRHAPTAPSCGCSPLGGPLTPAALAPAAGLLLTSVIGLVAAGLRTDALSPVAEGAVGAPLILPCLWGGTLAGIALLFPATPPPPEQQL